MQKIKIGFIVNQVSSDPGGEPIVSGHAQLPLQTMIMLHNSGYDVQLITTDFSEKKGLPEWFPTEIIVHQTPYGVRLDTRQSGSDRPLQPLQVFQQIKILRKIIEQEKYDLLHFFGGYRLAYLGGLLGMCGVKTPKVLTLSISPFPDPAWPLTKFLWKQFSLVLTTTNFMKSLCLKHGVHAEVSKHGILKKLNRGTLGNKKKEKFRVLFWRDPTFVNGADLCLDIFLELAPKYPDISFDMALRPHKHSIPHLIEGSNQFHNVNVFHYPYANGVTLENLIGESICILMPFRKLSVQPQWSILESMEAGATVVTSSIESNIELIHNGHNGFLVKPGDKDDTLLTVENLLMNPEKALQAGLRASQDVQSQWTWDTWLTNLENAYQKVI